MDTPFKQELIKKLQEKSLSENSIKLYVRNLEILNNNQPLKNLNFLKKVEEIIEKLSLKKPNTVRIYLISISVSLQVIKGDNKQMNKLYEIYHKLMMDKALEIKENNTKEVPEEKKESFITWKEVGEKHAELKDKVSKFGLGINNHQYKTLLDYVILSLYYLVPPRRNRDYALAYLVENCGDHTNDIKQNFVCVNDKKFIFNNFKTSRKEGQVTLPIPDDLMEVIRLYMRYHPCVRNMQVEPKVDISKKKKSSLKVQNRPQLYCPFLVDYEGNPFVKNNDMTRILNRIFDKKIGSSMLRSIYLTDKYGGINEQREQDAKAMSHSVETANEYYIKNK